MDSHKQDIDGVQVTWVFDERNTLPVIRGKFLLTASDYGLTSRGTLDVFIKSEDGSCIADLKAPGFVRLQDPQQMGESAKVMLDRLREEIVKKRTSRRA